MRTTILALSSLASLAFATPSLAYGDPMVEDSVFAQRGLTLAPGIFRIDAAFQIAELINDTYFGFMGAVSWSPLLNLEIGAVALPLSIAPDADYGNPRVWGRYRFLRGTTEVGAELGFTFNKVNELTLGLPVRFHLNPAARLDIRPTLVFDFPGSNDPDGTETTVGFGIPLELAVSLTRQIYVTVNSGLVIPEFDFDAAAIPLGVGVGYSIPNGDSAYLDFGLNFTLPAFIPFADGADVPNSSGWVLSLGATLHLGE